MIDNDKIIYIKTFEQKKVYLANRAYWYKKIKKYVNKEKKNDWYQHFSKGIHNEISNYPICVFYNQTLNKCIRIIQYSPNDYNEKYKYKQYFTAWISEIEIDKKEVPELVICLLLTHNNGQLAEKLINLWIKNNDINLLQQEIQRIYNQQNN